MVTRVPDELAAKRGDRISGAPHPSLTDFDPAPKEPTGTKERRPPLWRWFSAQTAHSIPGRATAAKHVKDRFNIAFVTFSKIDRALAKEDSEHLVAFRELLDEYRALYDIIDDDDNFARETGVGGKMLPYAVEVCGKCHREAIPGTGQCARHGGQWISEKDMADISRRLRERVLVMSESALRVLQDLMDNGKSEQVRSQAAAMVLDRAGFGVSSNVHHTGSISITDSDAATQAIQVRLETLAVNMAKKAELMAAAEFSTGEHTGVDGLADIVDAEVVEA